MSASPSCCSARDAAGPSTARLLNVDPVSRRRPADDRDRRFGDAYEKTRRARLLRSRPRARRALPASRAGSSASCRWRKPRRYASMPRPAERQSGATLRRPLRRQPRLHGHDGIPVRRAAFTAADDRRRARRPRQRDSRATICADETRSASACASGKRRPLRTVVGVAGTFDTTASTPSHASDLPAPRPVVDAGMCSSCGPPIRVARLRHAGRDRLGRSEPARHESRDDAPIIAASAAGRRFLAGLLSVFAALATVLTAIGSSASSRRSSATDAGDRIRIALGADRFTIARAHLSPRALPDGRRIALGVFARFCSARSSRASSSESGRRIRWPCPRHRAHPGRRRRREPHPRARARTIRSSPTHRMTRRPS